MMSYNSSENYTLSQAQSRLLRESESRALALHGRLRALRDASIEVADEWTEGALDSLTAHLRAALPNTLITQVESRSGMEWSVFVGHCISWWESARTPKLMSTQPAQEYHPFFLTLVERLASLDLFLEGFYWNQHRRVTVLWGEPPWWPLIVGALLGIIASQGGWWAPWPLMISLGLMLGWVWRLLLGKERYCGGASCGVSLAKNIDRCPRCGGQLIQR